MLPAVVDSTETETNLYCSHIHKQNSDSTDAQTLAGDDDHTIFPYNVSV